ASTSSAPARRCRLPPRPARSCTARCARWWVRWCSSAKAAGARTTSPPRWRRATARPARRWRRPKGSIWCRSTTEFTPSSAEIALENPPIDRGQGREVGHAGALVDLMHGGAHEPELEHRAIVLDEARVRGAAGGRQLGPAAGDFLDRADHEIEEWAARG